ncbi:hypothetical protein DIPPA_35511 [Diplonema papillatum]|nr:hypothetical protein DIPPA_35511 [Diplonema papillatum]|eukprot:gene8397-12939_t
MARQLRSGYHYLQRAGIETGELKLHGDRLGTSGSARERCAEASDQLVKSLAEIGGGASQARLGTIGPLMTLRNPRVVQQVLRGDKRLVAGVSMAHPTRQPATVKTELYRLHNVCKTLNEPVTFDGDATVSGHELCAAVTPRPLLRFRPEDALSQFTAIVDSSFPFDHFGRLAAICHAHQIGSILVPADGVASYDILGPEVLADSGGHVDRIDVHSVEGPSVVLRRAKQEGFTVYGIDDGAPADGANTIPVDSLEELAEGARAIFVLGGPQASLGHLRQYCDRVVTLPSTCKPCVPGAAALAPANLMCIALSRLSPKRRAKAGRRPR